MSLPRGSCDCHVHVFDPAKFPYAPERAYTPPPAKVESLATLLESLSAERVVLVQPSVYGADNRCLLDALARLGQHRARGIAVVDLDRVTDHEIDRLHDAGVRGIRLNLHVSGDASAAAQTQVRRAAQVVKRPGWSLQVHARLDLVVALMDEFKRLDAPVVIDHYAGGLTPDPASEDLLAQLLLAMATHPLYVKLSAPYRLWNGAGPDHVLRLAREFVRAAPERVLWGSDWPHTGGSGTRASGRDAIEPFRQIDNAQVLRDLLACLPDSEHHRLLVSNPAALYGFPG